MAETHASNVWHDRTTKNLTDWKPVGARKGERYRKR